MNDQSFNGLPHQTEGMPEQTSDISTPSPEAPVQIPASAPAEERYVYRWSYGEQVAHDRAEHRKTRKKGAAVYAVVMTVAFLLCLCFLGGVLYLNATAPEEALTTAEVAEIVNPSTVLIYAASNGSSGYGTGFFVRSDGFIATNYHVVAGAKTVSVTLYSGEELEASVKWYSAADDLALLYVEGNGYPTVAIGNSDTLKVGETAIAIGNPAGNLCPWTTTQGIISATVREISVEGSLAIIDMNLIQTDAQVNPGNSGGPLCNDRGEVIGIITRKMTDYEGLGLAIPINGAMELINAYLETGSTDHIRSSVSHVRPTIGIQAAAVKQGDPITNEYSAPKDGILVVGLTANGPAVGVLEPGDLILEMDGVRVTDMEVLRERLYEYRAGDSVKFKVDRLGELIEVTVTLGVAQKG